MVKIKKYISMVCFVLIFFCVVFCVSYAWYEAQANKGKVENLSSEGVSITLENSDTTLKPDVLKQGVLIPYFDGYDAETLKEIVSGEWLVPIDYDSKYYEPGTTVSLTGDIYLIIDSPAGSDARNLLFSYQICYLDSNMEQVFLTEEETTKYFSFSNQELLNGDSEFNTSDIPNGEYNLELAFDLAYNLPDELLPIELVNSKQLIVKVSVNLQ